ncbi:MAG: glycosyltransferase family 39 protein [Acidimicrobiia bacterium]|nr:glycosyltransferase family 39 protein [Acidimicrobiia bacterium]
MASDRIAPPGPARPSRRFFLALGAVSALAFLVRVLIIVIVEPRVPALGDASAYHLLANHLADGRGYIRPFDLTRFGLVVPTAEYPPLHPFVLSLFARLGVRSVEGQRLVLAVIGTAGVGGIGWVGRRMVSTRVGLVAAALAAVSPMVFLSEATLMSETIFMALVVAALALTIRAREQATIARFLALGIVLGLAVLTRAEAGVLAVLLIVPAAVFAPQVTARRRILVVATGLIAMVAVVVPWTVRNQTTFHAFVPVSNNLGTALAGANCSLTYSGSSLGSWRSTFGAGDTAAGECFTGFNGREPHFNEAVAAGRARRQGLDYFGDHLAQTPKVAAARVLRTFGLFRPGQQIELEALEGRPIGWERLGTWLDWVLMPLAAVGLVLAFRRRLGIWPLLAPVVIVVVSSILTYGNQRFRIGAEPTIVIGAAITLVAVADRIRNRSTPTTQVAAG